MSLTGVPEGSDLAAPANPRLSRDPSGTTIWLHGDQDISTSAQITRAIFLAAAADHLDVVIDIRGVSFIDASTIGAFVGGRAVLRKQSRELILRGAPRAVRRILELCGLGSLMTPDPGPATTALGTWVAVRPSERASQPVHRRLEIAPEPTYDHVVVERPVYRDET